MEGIATVQGSAAKLYPGFTYRLAVPVHLDIWQLDPERLNYASVYPRSVNSPSQAAPKVVELADYTVRTGDLGTDGKCPVQVWMQPNEYTSARWPLLVYEALVAYPPQKFWYKEAVQRAFSLNKP